MASQLAGAVLLGTLLATPVWAEESIQGATVCHVDSQLRKYRGKMVRVRGRVVQFFEGFFIESEGCGLDLAYPDEPSDLGAMATFQPYPEPRMRAKFKLERDDNYKKLVDFANSRASLPDGCLCLGCYRYDVTATITGLLEVAKRGRPGFGHMNSARARLVIRSVSDVQAVDMSSRYKDMVCGPPRLSLPRSPNPAWDHPVIVPAFPNTKPDRK
jgi:hypothetical protein